MALAFALAMCIVRYWLVRVRGPLTLEQRALWCQQAAKGILAGVGIHYRIQGQPPTRGLVVANHLSYLDILILSAAMPCFFVAKVEIGGWPFFGKSARVGGTIFVDRTSLASAMSVAEQMSERFKQTSIPVLLFPEGTSTDGNMLRFHSRLIDPATSAGVPITAAAVRYVIEGGEEKDLCWYDDTLFLPHLLQTLRTPGFSGEVIFGEPKVYLNRRIAADATYAEISEMRERGAFAPQKS